MGLTMIKTFQNDYDSIKEAIFSTMIHKIDNDPSFHKYHNSYLHFIDFFHKKSVIKFNDFVIGAHFSYGWMPTILDFDARNDIDESKVVALINKAKMAEKFDDLSKNEYEYLKSIINNSYIGLSKLLHFINPSVYGIWDSRVHRFLMEATSDKRKTIQPNYYGLFESYQLLLAHLINHIDLSNFLTDHKLTAIRKLELLMFVNGKKK